MLVVKETIRPVSKSFFYETILSQLSLSSHIQEPIFYIFTICRILHLNISSPPSISSHSSLPLLICSSRNQIFTTLSVKAIFLQVFLILWTSMRFLNFQCDCSQVSKEYLKVEMLLLLQSDLSDNQTCPTTVLLSICLKVRIAKPKLFNLSEHYF